MEVRTEPKKQVENKTEAKTEDLGEAEDRPETKRKQKRKTKHALFPKWGLQLNVITLNPKTLISEHPLKQEPHLGVGAPTTYKYK